MTWTPQHMATWTIWVIWEFFFGRLQITNLTTPCPKTMSGIVSFGFWVCIYMYVWILWFEIRTLPGPDHFNPSDSVTHVNPLELFFIHRHTVHSGMYTKSGHFHFQSKKILEYNAMSGCRPWKSSDDEDVVEIKSHQIENNMLNSSCG